MSFPGQMVLDEYRKYFPEGAIPPEIEEQGTWGARWMEDCSRCSLKFLLKGWEKAFELFVVDVRHRTREITVVEVNDPAVLLTNELDGFSRPKKSKPDPGRVKDRELEALPLQVVMMEFRKFFPEGLIPPEKERQGIWLPKSVGDSWRYELIYWLKGRKDPFSLFVADITKRTLDVTVIKVSDVAVLLNSELGGGDFATV